MGEEERLEASSQKEDSGVPKRREGWIHGGMEQQVHQQDGLVITAYLSSNLYPTERTYLGLKNQYQITYCQKIKYLVISLTNRSKRQRGD